MSAQTRRLQRRLEAIPKAVKSAVHPALIQSGNEIAGTMKTLAPVDTGALRDSIEVTAPGTASPPYSQPGGSRLAAENEVLITVGNEDVRYPHLVEYGTQNSSAQPFFWPAFRLLRKKASNRIKRAVSKAVKTEWVK
ncbi:HK97-gp10 family putative phage morphogenesis protein [Pelagibacterium mangrovi]|uniref:HK97-gp10 family putative phage morphogenesis protein n=1 Tax=Pelagibacterium mangrovi TaxID=3119828 RepID=UPI002FCAD47E